MKLAFFAAPTLFLALVGCHEAPQPPPDRSAPIKTRVFAISSSSTRPLLKLEGVVAARQVAEISAQVLAPVLSVQVREGDHVRKGQVLVLLSSAPLQAAFERSKAQVQAAAMEQASAESQRKLAAATYARYAMLNERHSVTPHEFDQVKAQLDTASAASQASAAEVAAAEAAARGAQAATSYTTLRAPFSGVVTKKFVDAGAMAAPGTPLIEVEDATEHEVDLQVNEATLGQFHIGTPVQVSIDGSASLLAGIVKELVPGGDPVAHSFMVKIALPSASAIYSGMTAQVLVPGPEQSRLLLPAVAIRRRGQLDSVLALDAGSIAQIRYVSLGRPEGSEIEVLGGLATGDRILAQPDDSLIGLRIEPQP